MGSARAGDAQCLVYVIHNVLGYVQSGNPKTWIQLEQEMLNGQKLQGVTTSNEVQEVSTPCDACVLLSLPLCPPAGAHPQSVQG